MVPGMAGGGAGFLKRDVGDIWADRSCGAMVALVGNGSSRGATVAVMGNSRTYVGVRNSRRCEPGGEQG